MKYLMEIINATKRFGGLQANEDISFNVSKGEIVGIVGPNGAGKTTLFNSISGVNCVTSGKIIFDGIDITKKKSHEISKLGIGRTFQIPQSVNALSVYENVLVGSLCHNSDLNKAIHITEQVLEECELFRLKDDLAAKLTVTQKKRLEIARALATSPILLLLDETMAGLTATERKESIKLIKQINSSGITIMTIEHNMDVVMSVSDRVVVLESGKVLAIGTPNEVTNNPKVIKAYLGVGKHA